MNGRICVGFVRNGRRIRVGFVRSGQFRLFEWMELAKLSDHTSKSGQSGVGSAWIGARFEKLTVQIHVGFVAKLYTFDDES